MSYVNNAANRDSDYDEDDYEYEDEPLPFARIQKNSVLQGCRDFNNATVDVPKCMDHMNNMLYILGTGAQLTSTEATDVYFAATKLFQNKNAPLRRLLFILLKELAVTADNAFVASNSVLLKENTAGGHGFRCLRKIADINLVRTVSRDLLQAIGHEDTNVVMAALVTGIHLSREDPQLVKAWGPKVVNTLETGGSKVQYASLALLHKIRKNDRLSVHKLVQQAQDGPIRSPLAQCLLIRMCGELLQSDFDNSLDLYKFVTSRTHHSSDMVVFEAAQCIASLKNVSDKEVVPAVLAVAPYLGCTKPTLQYSAMSLLNKVATAHPAAVTSTTNDIESLLHHPNSAVATLAITTLLKVGNEYSIDRLLRDLSTNLKLTGDSKLIVVESTQVIAMKFPHKYPMILDFLLQTYQQPEPASAEFKLSIVEAMLHISRTVPAARESVLRQLANAIEDCYYPSVTQLVLTVLGDEGPRSANPKHFIRFIYNRVQLEFPTIRAVAITTLAKFAAGVPSLRKSICVLLKRATVDPDDEVRDRAVFYYKLFQRNDEVAISTLISNVSVHVDRERDAVLPKSAIVEEVKGAQQAQQEMSSSAVVSSTGNTAEEGGSTFGVPSAAVQPFVNKLRNVPEIKALGQPLASTEPVALTEPTNEFVVTLVKHFYASKIVMQFKVVNTMESITMHNYSVLTDTDELEGTVPLYGVAIDLLPPAETGYAYLVLEREEGTFPSGLVECSCSFSLCEPGEEISDPEELAMDAFGVNVSDYVVPVDLGTRFEGQWTQFNGEETIDTYPLPSIKSLTEAGLKIIDFFGMWVEGGSLPKITTKSHVINMAGVLAVDAKTVILVSAKVYVAVNNTVALELSIRGGDEELRAFLSEALTSS